MGPQHEIWRRVDHDYTEAKKRAPAGYEPVVEVLLAGHAEPLTLGFVETRREDPWVRFEADVKRMQDVDDSVALPAACYWVHVPEASILGIEVRFRTTGDRAPVGFTHRSSGS
jgi:hypothetical protein